MNLRRWLRRDLSASADPDPQSREIGHGAERLGGGRDPVTGLRTLADFEQLLDQEALQAASLNRNFSLLVVAVDDFAGVSARFGRAEADAVLAEIAARLATSARATDVVARLSEDEFAVLLRDATADGIRSFHQRFQTSVFDRPTLTRVRVGASAGAIEYSGDPSATMLARARPALEKARTRGKWHLVIAFDDTAGQSVRDRGTRPSTRPGDRRRSG